MKLSIHYKITTIFIITNALLCFGIYFYLRHIFIEDTYQRVRNHLQHQIILSKKYLEKELLLTKNYKQTADQIGRALDLRVSIITFDGTVVGDTNILPQNLKKVENHLQRKEIQQALKSGIGEDCRFSETIKKDMLYLAIPYQVQQQQGILRFSIPLLEIELISSQLQNTLIISMIIAFSLTMIISYFLSILITQPIRQISKNAQKIAQGNLSEKIKIFSQDEIGDLAQSFNYMSEQINLRMKDIIEHRSKLEAVLLSIFDGVMVVDQNANILLINQTLQKILNINQNLHSPQKAISILHNLQLQEIIKKTLTLRGGVESREIIFITPEEKIMEIHATPVLQENICKGAVLVFHDITKIRNLERIRKDFVANVSHELKTPVTIIKGYAETLQTGAIEDHQNAQDFIKIIHQEANTLSRLIDDLLDLSKIESGKISLKLKPLQIEPLVQRVLDGLNQQIKLKSIDIIIDIPNDLKPVLMDELQIIQVLLNLIENAIKYNNPGGKITIAAHEEKNYLHVSITDTGFGIPEKNQPRIFERFYRVDKGRSRQLGGTGLGLSIAKHIIQAHHGSIVLNSSFGKGSTFTFTLPQISS